MDGWMDGPMDKWNNTWLDDGPMDEWMNQWMNGIIHGWMDG